MLPLATASELRYFNSVSVRGFVRRSVAQERPALAYSHSVGKSGPLPAARSRVQPPMHPVTPRDSSVNVDVRRHQTSRPCDGGRRYRVHVLHHQVPWSDSRATVRIRVQ